MTTTDAKLRRNAIIAGASTILVVMALFCYLITTIDFTFGGLALGLILGYFALWHLPRIIAHSVYEAAVQRQKERPYQATVGSRKHKPAEESWTNVILPEATKTELMTLQRILRDPMSYHKRWGIAPPTGAILYGPPGTGKTLIARTLADSAGYTFLAPSPAELTNRWVGESEKAIAALYEQARESAPAVIFLDELDSVAAGRSGTAGDSGGAVRGYNNATNQLLQEIDGFKGRHDIFTVGATNRLDILDPAITSRLSMHIHIALPDQQARVHLFAIYTHPFRDRLTVDVNVLAAKGTGLSGRDIQEGCKRAVLIAESSAQETVGLREFATAFRYMFSQPPAS